MKNTQSPVLKWSLIIGIVIVLNLFFNYAINLVYPAPDSNSFWDARTEEECVAVGGEWTTPETPEAVTPKTEGFCDAREAYDAVRVPYERTVFMVLVVLGAASLIVGLSLATYSAVAAGLSYGGVLSLIIASMRYWSSANDVVRLVILAIALAALIYVGVKQFSDK